MTFLVIDKNSGCLPEVQQPQSQLGHDFSHVGRDDDVDTFRFIRLE